MSSAGVRVGWLKVETEPVLWMFIHVLDPLLSVLGSDCGAWMGVSLTTGVLYLNRSGP